MSNFEFNFISFVTIHLAKAYSAKLFSTYQFNILIWVKETNTVQVTIFWFIALSPPLLKKVSWFNSFLPGQHFWTLLQTCSIGQKLYLCNKCKTLYWNGYETLYFRGMLLQLGNSSNMKASPANLEQKLGKQLWIFPAILIKNIRERITFINLTP